jgi:pimeloyl-ACP methyl ester carboxylesterase
MTRPQVDTIMIDGERRLAVHRLSEGDTGRTIVWCHPTPGAGTFDPDPDHTWRRGVTLLAVDRPGYGASDPVPDTAWGSVSRAADDLATVLRRVGGAPVGVVGWAAGGWIAFSLAARHPQLVDRVVVLGTPAPHDHIPWMPTDHHVLLERLRGLPPATVRATLLQHLTGMIPRDMRDAAALSLLGVSAADDQVLAQPAARDRLTQMLTAAFTQGAMGMVTDIAGYGLHPWGFEPHEVQAKTLLLYGSKDPIAGSRHGMWWQKQLPNARLEVVPGAGHLLVIPMWNRVLAHLAPGAKRKQ